MNSLIFQFDETSMRNHLVQCFLKQKLSTFPATSTTKNSVVLKTITVPVYCHCRAPEDKKKKMAMCQIFEDWFHTTFDEICSLVFKKKKLFTCSRCYK